MASITLAALMILARDRRSASGSADIDVVMSTGTSGVMVVFNYEQSQA